MSRKSASRSATMTPPLTAILVGIVASVAVLTPWTGDAFGLPKLTVLFLTALAGWGLVLVGRTAPLAGPAKAPIALACAVYAVAILLASLTSSAPADSLLGRYERYGGFVPLVVQLALAALVYATCAGRPDRARLVAAAIVAGATTCALYVLAQTAGFDFLDWKDASGNDIKLQAGTLGNPNFTGAFLGISLAFVPMLVRDLRRNPRLAAAAATAGAVCGAAMLATQSRGGLLATAAAGLVLAVVHGPAFLRATTIAVRLALAAGTVALVVGTYVLATTTSLGRTESLDVRARQWQAAARVARDHPIVGTGPDTFQLYFPEYRSREDGRLLALDLADKPHNLPLEHAQGAGLVGLAAYLFLLATVGRVALRSLRRADDRWLPAAFAAAAAGHFAQSMFSIDVTPLAMAWWLAAAGIAALAAPAALDAPVKRARRVRVPAVAVVLVVVALAWVGTRPWRADWAGAAGDHERAVQLNPTQAVLHLNRGDAAGAAIRDARGADDAARALAEGREAYDAAIGLQPRSVYAALGRAQLEAIAASRLGASGFRNADEWFARAAELDPHDWQIHAEWGLVLNAWADTTDDAQLKQRAGDRMAVAAEIRPDLGQGPEPPPAG